MDLADVMDELAAQLDEIEGLRVHPYWADRIQPPAVVVGWPEPLTYDLTMGRGMDRVTLPIIVLVGKVDARSARTAAAAYANPVGPSSVKRAIESHDQPVSYHEARVQTAEFSAISVAGTEYLAITFSTDIAGPGG